MTGATDGLKRFYFGDRLKRNENKQESQRFIFYVAIPLMYSQAKKVFVCISFLIVKATV